jgi:endonuclease YncB( thermonuclease family)
MWPRVSGLILALLLPNLVLADTIHKGKVVKIADGDTLTILVDNQ